MAGHSPEDVAEFERETWNRCAQRYEETFALLTNEAAPLLVEAANIKSGTRVLEIGSGSGNVAGKLAAAGAAVDAIDYSEPMIAVAKRNHPEIRFQRANAENVPFDDETFDAVIASLIVHHLARPVDVFKEVHRVLKPGACFAFAVWGPEEEQTGFGVFFGALMAHSDLDLTALPFGPLFGVTDRESYEALVSGAGFRKFQLDAHKVAWKAKTLAPILRGMSDWANLLAFPQELQEKVEASTRENAKPFEKAGGHYVFPHSLVLGRAFRP
jgi:ubiquinone/menaquinone biosynthesis C-methylase UbiE